MSAARDQSRRSIRRLIVKVGSAVIADESGLRLEMIARLAEQLAWARRGGAGVVVVSSGAVACGLKPLGLKRFPRTIVEKQAAAALGQQALMSAWSAALAPHGALAAQVLLTAEDLADRARFLNARRTLEALLDKGVIPVVNENDSVSHAEIRFGDNDRLSALVAHLIDADLLLMLTTVDGLCEGGGAGAVIPVVKPGDAVEAHLAPARTPTGVGGMATKLEAARLAVEAGVEAVVAPGAEQRVLVRVLAGEALGTRFIVDASGADASAGAARRRWLLHVARVKGRIVVDAGAEKAIRERGASLLPSGVVRVEGLFRAGDVVDIASQAGEPIARALASYDARDVERIAGAHTSQIEQRLGACYSEEVAHRDDMALVPPAPSRATTGERRR